MFEAIKIYYNKLQSHFAWFISVIILVSILFYLLGLLINTGKDPDGTIVSYLASTLRMIGSAGMTAAVFQVIIKSTAFMNVLKDTLDVDQRNWKQYSDNKIKEVLKSIKEAKNFVKISYVDEREKSIKLAKKALTKQIDAIKKKETRTDEDEQLLSKNYFLEESRITKTILKNGSEITTFEVDIRFFKKGNFIFRVENWTDCENLTYPPFNYFKENECEKRFSDFSFSSMYFNLQKKGQIVDKDRYAKLKLQHKDFDNQKGFELIFSIDDTFEENDFFILSFSTTIKDTYTDENLHRIETGQDPKPFSSTSSPVGVRNITIQEEIYGNNDYSSKIRPSLTIDDEHIEPSLQKQSIFYKTYQWSIYYHEYQYEKISYSVL